MNLSTLKRFEAEQLEKSQIEAIEILAAKVRRNAIEMILNGGSGHPGGSLSSTDIYIMLWLCCDTEAEKCSFPERDRIVVSHGHTAAAVYSVLGNLGFFDLKKALDGFRKGGSIFEGHPGLKVPGIEWCSGSLGQGLSVGCGFALASKLRKRDYHVFVVMGDGEQTKGQIAEAGEFAVKYGLSNLTAIVDHNRLQASGRLSEVMPQKIARKYEAAGWNVIKINGHDLNEIYTALRKCYRGNGTPTLVLADTVMGKGVSFIEDRHEYHGKVLTAQEYKQAAGELTYDANVCSAVAQACKVRGARSCRDGQQSECYVEYGNAVLYEPGSLVDCRSAFGEALCSIAGANAGNAEVHIAALDCDLAESVKLQKFGKMFPESLVECGIQEHNAATVAGALSKAGILTFYADFGVFGIDETYGQHRMADLNDTSVKLICTHTGLDVGEDGKTHQCIDYIGIMSNLFGYKLIIPADANHTDRVIRYITTTPGNFAVAMGRSKVPVLGGTDNKAFFGQDYRFRYGNADWIRRGKNGTVITCGTMVHRAVRASEKLAGRGLDIGVLNLSCPTELDEDKLGEAAATGLIVTYEDHSVRTGIGSIIGAYLLENGITCKFRRLGITRYGVSGSPEYQYELQSLNEDSLCETVAALLKSNMNQILI